MSENRYEFIKEGEITRIVANARDPELPKLGASVEPDPGLPIYRIRIRVNDEPLAYTELYRDSHAFACRVAKFMHKGCLSRLGKHRRLTKNRQAKREVENKEVA